MPAPAISLDQIYSERQFFVKSTAKGDALTKVHKAPASWNGDERSASFVMTAEVVDRYGDVVVTKGGDLTEFEINPVCLWAHNSYVHPIGMWSDLKKISGSPKRLEGKTTLAPEETTPEADKVARLLATNMVRACSIGFIPKQWEAIRDDRDRIVGFKFLEWELLECSICSVPANPAAIMKAAGGDQNAANLAVAMVLEEWSQTPEGLIVPRKEYERAYAVTKQAGVEVHEVRAIEEEAETIDDSTDMEERIKAVVEQSFTTVLRNIFGSVFGNAEKPKTIDLALNVDTSEAVEHLREIGDVAQRAADAEAARQREADAATAQAALEEENRKIAERATAELDTAALEHENLEAENRFAALMLEEA